MLGEAARTAEDAKKYFQSYETAITAIGQVANGLGPIQAPGISIKLSALHPRYEYSQRTRILKELAPRLLSLAQQAKAQNIGLTVDAEEADRLELSLEVFDKVFSDSSLAGWEGFGLAVQSYQKRAPAVIDWLINLSQKHKRRIMVRLIKGAYWDTEIKLSQVQGFSGYPVFTRKNSTDVSFIACAKKLIEHNDCFYPQFGSHNAYSVATVMELVSAHPNLAYEFQCLHGMGQPLYDQLIEDKNLNINCRIYAPVGSHQDLLGYLVRRLLENGANTSFINRIADEKTPIEKLIANPVERVSKMTSLPHPQIPLPNNIFGSSRKNSRGVDLSNSTERSELFRKMNDVADTTWQSGPIISGKMISRPTPLAINSPSQLNQTVGYVTQATAEDVELALEQADSNKHSWTTLSVDERAKCLEKAADLFEEAIPMFVTLLCREAGKHIIDCLSEIRETVDFCRYYAEQARSCLSPQILPGPTGEYNELSLHPRGIIVCISPWNFPLAIFAGQVLAALVTGNAVIAKPAEQTPLVAAEAIRILHKAGIPQTALHLLPGRGEIVGAKLVADERINGVMFTGSTETAKLIQQRLAERSGPIVPFVAETGGQNVMIVDSSALPEQVVADVITSAFNSAGQRCSALRVLFIQDDIAPRLLPMLKGAMSELTVGDPGDLATDIGPVIDTDALKMLQEHAKKMSHEGTLLFEVPISGSNNGHYFAPCAFEISDLDLLKREVFGPILHIITFKANNLNKMLEKINKTGYGLTLGIHSRIDATINHIKDTVSVGNIYVNRNMVGAVVGVQPFGGEGLSGTGPKAGGPLYLPRLCIERAVSINTTAAGGNTTLISLNEGD